MRPIKKISIITPCFNAGRYLEETILSVIHQTAIVEGKIVLEYIICDGGSSDNTMSIARKYEKEFNLIVISEKDKGMYDALSKGLKMISGDVCAYLNAGDYYSKTAFDVVIEIMENNDVQWLTGINTYYNDHSAIFSFFIPFRYRRSFIRKGVYGTILPFIQQESTFWRTELNLMIDTQQLRQFKVAGDFYLWHSFAMKYPLFIVQAYLGGFKVHAGQLSSDLGKYKNEMRQVARAGLLTKLMAYMEFFIWHLPPGWKKRFNKKCYFTYNVETGFWER